MVSSISVQTPAELQSCLMKDDGSDCGGSTRGVWRRWAAALVVTVTAVGCTLTDAGGEPWSRTYVRTFDRVWQATVTTLEEED